jgi:hypothetical protein
LAVVFDLEKMNAPETAGQSSIRIEPEDDAFAGRVRLHPIAHGAVASHRSRRERPIEAHRGPSVMGPETIVFTGQTVDERSHGTCGG